MQRSRLVLTHLVVWLCFGCAFGVRAGMAQTSASASQQAGILLPYWAFVLLLGLTLLSLAALLVVRRRYRRPRPRSDDAAYSPLRLNGADYHPDRRPALERELAEIKTNHARLLKVYNQLLNRHKALIRDVQQLHQRARAGRTPQAPSNVSS